MRKSFYSKLFVLSSVFKYDMETVRGQDFQKKNIPLIQQSP